MIKATFNVDKSNCENKIFNYNGYNPWNEIRKNLKKSNIELNTQDINPPEESELIVDFNVPRKLINFECKRYLLQLESEAILKRNYDPRFLKKYDLVFTWNDILVDNNKYIKINYPQAEPVNNFDCKDFNEKKLCTMVAANKYYRHNQELYSKRINAIYWFEKNHPDEFDLYGHDWDKFQFRNFLSRLNDYIKIIKIPPIFRFKTYRGSVVNKKEVLNTYKFSICFENSQFPGYISEKIFDCFNAKNVPIYLGAPNIMDYIPKNTFIDMREFTSYEDLYFYLVNMKKDEYNLYIKNTDDFLHSPEYNKFTSEEFVNIISNSIINNFFSVPDKFNTA